MKVDTQNGKHLQWIRKGVWVSEPVFVQNPTIQNPAEDDGVIVANLLHAEDLNKTTLLILDARTMTELATVEFKTDGPVTSTFHGQWAQTGDKIHLY